jgi:hypothetical protein
MFGITLILSSLAWAIFQLYFNYTQLYILL